MLSVISLSYLSVRQPRRKQIHAFTLIELLVVVGIIGLLGTMLMAGISAARAAGQRAYCANSLRQLFLANNLYAIDTGYYVAAAPDIATARNLERWHGTRGSAAAPFDESRGPLTPYLGPNYKLRTCPAFLGFKNKESAANAFEASCGAYGYNIRGVGSQLYLKADQQVAMSQGMPPFMIKEPARTVMFCDCAFPQPYGNPTYLIEYSFAEAYYHVSGDPPHEASVALPSIHFRHRGYANVVWCDGHVSAERMSIPGLPEFAKFGIGWFGPKDNSLFDPF